MEAGRLRERVTIEGPTRVSNGQGGWTTGWADVADKVPAEIIAMSGDEALRLNVETSTVRYRVTMRKREGLTPKNRLRFGSELLEVRSVQRHPQAPNSHLLLICEAGVVN
jgi:SPP1 family predicted phage head-tail adaptor